MATKFFDDFDDSDADSASEFDAPRFPGTVLTAGIIWIGFGGLGLLNWVFTIAMAAQQPVGVGGGAGGNAGSPAGSCCGFAVAMAFLLVGIQTVRGTAKDTRGNAIGSIFFALLQLAIGFIFVGVGAAAMNQPAAPPGPGAPPAQGFLAGAGFEPGVAILVGVIVCVMGMTMMMAGVLALVGRKRYLEWREYYHPTPRKRKWRRRDDRDEEDDEDDDDDRPRRRRSRDDD